MEINITEEYLMEIDSEVASLEACGIIENDKEYMNAMAIYVSKDFQISLEEALQIVESYFNN